MKFLFAAYTAIWILFFGYAMSISRRQRKLEDDLSQVREQLDRRK